ncbi:MAG: DUF2802 domain-containing protein [Rhodocyclaceae bacterium]|nr:DUF2802 domain-containing protein [Rhodocyclaceae bacterium]
MTAFSLGWRDGILLLVVLAAVYLVVMLIKLVQIGRRRPTPSEPLGRSEAVPPAPSVPPPKSREAEPPTPPLPGASSVTTALSAYQEAAAQAPAEPYAVLPEPTFEWDEVRELLGEEQAAPAPPPPPVAPAPNRPGGHGGFGESLAEHLARSEVEMEVQRMRDELARMRAEMEQLRAAQRVSPQYAEAMELMQRGLSAQAVADRLGISLAEAELVQALSRGDGHFDEGDEDGGEGNAANDGYDAYGPGSRR